MDWETLYCPNRRCLCYGMPFKKGRLVKNGSRHGEKRALCKACGRRIALTYAAAYLPATSEPAQATCQRRGSHHMRHEKPKSCEVTALQKSENQ
jgi:hypothetical protein